MDGTHKRELWGQYIDCMCAGTSIRDTAERVGISVPTAFYWRHKILSALERLFDRKPPELRGIIELDITYMLRSYKGFRPDAPKKDFADDIGREPRIRGGTASSPGITDEYISIVVACDRNGNTRCRISGSGRVTADELKSSLADDSFAPAAICTDAETGIRSFCRQLNTNHQELNQSPGERKRGLFHINNVNAVHSRLKRFLKSFNGVATKYLQNYLNWFQLLDSISSLTLKSKVENFALNAFEEPVNLSNSQLLPAS